MSHVVQRPSGIVVPSATLDKKQERLTRDDFRLLVRFFKAGRARKWVGMYVCTDCKEPVQIRQHDRLVTSVPVESGTVNAPGGNYSLACGCTQWTVK